MVFSLAVYETVKFLRFFALNLPVLRQFANYPAQFERQICDHSRPTRKSAMATILVVDDETLVQTTLERILGRAGHDVTFCESGRQALAVFTARRFDAVLSDVRMPDGDGGWLLREIRKIDAELPVFLMTGLTEDRLLDGVVFDRRTTLLKKPLDLRGLIAMLAEIDGNKAP